MVERWRAEGLWRGWRGDWGRLGAAGERSWDRAAARFWVRTVVGAEGVAEREAMGGGRMAVREVFRGVPVPGVPMSLRGRGEFFRMELGEEGR